jgi:hypothetical protein
MKILDIHSPSKVLNLIGKYTIAGYHEGMTDEELWNGIKDWCKTKLDGLVQLFQKAVEIIGSLFGVATADNKRMFFGAEVGFNPVGGLMLTAKVDAHKDNTDSKYVIDTPKFRGEFMAEYTLKRWRFYCSANMMGAREWSFELDPEGNSVYEPFKSESTIDVRAGMSLRASSKWKIYIDGYNLLNARIYDYAYYYRNGMGVVAGVEIDF